jgi:aspartate 1-decarboxylase
MQHIVCRAKLSRATITALNPNYEGSIAIDEAILEAAGILPYEKILVGNITSGKRFETYVIPAPRGSRTVSLQGGTAHYGLPGDRIIGMVFGVFTAEELKGFRPKVLRLDEKNNVAGTSTV